MLIKIVGIIFVVISVLFAYSACIVSSRCSREEEKNNKYTNENKN